MTEHLPEQYQVCLCSLDTILKHAFGILQTSPDNREKAAGNGTIQRYSFGKAGITVKRYNYRQRLELYQANNNHSQNRLLLLLLLRLLTRTGTN